MKTFRLVRIDGSHEIIKFFELSKHCSVGEFSSCVQQLFGNSSTIGFSQVLCDSSGKKTDFEDLQNGKTYFITFEKKEKNSLLTWETAYSDFYPVTNSSRLKVLDQKEYLNIRINETKNLVKDKGAELITRQEDSLITLKQSLTKIHNTLGSQSLRIIDYTAKTNQIFTKTRGLVPILEKAIHDLKQVSEDLRTVYAYKPHFELVNIGKKKLMDPRILNYMKKFSYKDIPVNELTPGEMKRFMKFQIIMDNQIIPVSSQNTPSSKKSLKNISVSNPFTKKQT